MKSSKNDVEDSDHFVNLVDFKWLMAGAGWWVDLTRLQRDDSYVDECLQLALESESSVLRNMCFRLLDIPPRQLLFS